MVCRGSFPFKSIKELTDIYDENQEFTYIEEGEYGTGC